VTGAPAPARLRSLLFVPGDRPEMVAKATRTRPDGIVIDLEDGVATDRKAAARAAVGESIAAVSAADPRVRVFVRVNSLASPWFDDDLAALAPGVEVVLPKCESAADVAAAGGRGVVAGIESAAGVVRVAEIAAAPGVVAVYFGAEDYMADVGGRRTASNTEVLFARSAVVAGSRAAGVWPLDQVHVAVRDDDSFRRECTEALTLGFAGKLCIHPRQVELVHEMFAPAADELAAAARIVDAFEASAAAGSGICVVDGRMIDEPLARQARAVLDRARD
jgi:citrate lyase subunit beta/citryl-CoA lyase